MVADEGRSMQAIVAGEAESNSQIA